jgi:hypothetical protein
MFEIIDEKAPVEEEVEMIMVPRERLHRLVEWMQSDHDNLTCSDVCDKTWESQGCPSGTCARQDGNDEIRWWVNMLSA